MTLSEIVAQLRLCRFTCEGGALESSAAFVALEQLAEAGTWQPVEEPIDLNFYQDDYPGDVSIRTDQDGASIVFFNGVPVGGWLPPDLRFCRWQPHDGDAAR